MASTCITSLDFCAIRVARLTDSGAPLTGPTNGYVSDAPISLDVSIVTEEGDDLTSKNGCGLICATFQQPDQIKSLELTLELCQLDAELLEILTGAQVFMSGGNAIGLQFPEVGSQPPPVSFEGWSKAWATDHQLVDPSTAPDSTWIHWVFPGVRWVQGDFTVEHDLMVVTVNGKGQENPNLSVNGAFDDFPTEIAAAGGVTGLGAWFYDTEPPPATCDYVPVVSAS